MLPDGVVAVVKRDCPTCTLVAPVLDQLDGSVDLTVFREDDDTGLEFSWRNDVETVPTLLTRLEEVPGTSAWPSAFIACDWSANVARSTSSSALFDSLRIAAVTTKLTAAATRTPATTPRWSPRGVRAR